MSILRMLVGMSFDLFAIKPPEEFTFNTVYRELWGGRPAKLRVELETPVPYVVIYHSNKKCVTYTECKNDLLKMQAHDMDVRGLSDISYNFVIGSGGVVFLTRGWETLGEHDPYLNTISISICLMGDWKHEKSPLKGQIPTAKALIADGIERGHIKQDYKLISHCQLRAIQTDCSDEALFEEIHTWEHYSDFPISAHDLALVTELPDSVRQDLAHRLIGPKDEYIDLLLRQKRAKDQKNRHSDEKRVIFDVKIS